MARQDVIQDVSEPRQEAVNPVQHPEDATLLVMYAWDASAGVRPDVTEAVQLHHQETWDADAEKLADPVQDDPAQGDLPSDEAVHPLEALLVLAAPALDTQDAARSAEQSCVVAEAVPRSVVPDEGL